MEWEEGVSRCDILCHDRVRVRSASYFLYDNAIALKGGVGLVGW